MQELHNPPGLLHGDGLGLGGVPVGGEDPGLELVVHGLPRAGARHGQAGEVRDEEELLIIDGSALLRAQTVLSGQPCGHKPCPGPLTITRIYVYCLWQASDI